MTPLVSIIVNCFNQGCYLERSVKSVLSQTFTNIECLIVDDGSNDNTREVAENLTRLDSRVKYYHKENGGLPSSRNFGFQQAEGDWIQFLDADDWIGEDKIRFQLSYLQTADESQDIVFYSDYERVFLSVDETIVDRQEHIIGALTKNEFLERLLIPDFLTNMPHPALQQAMLMNKNVLLKSKFPETLKALGDRYFGVDILMKDVNLIYTPIVGAYYTRHQSNRTNNWNYMVQYYISFYDLVLKNYPELDSFCKTGLNFLLDEAVRESEEKNFQQLVKLVNPPINLTDNKIVFKSKSSLKLFYSLMSFTPKFLFYDKYRGPRSQKLISILSHLRGITKAKATS